MVVEQLYTVEIFVETIKFLEDHMDKIPKARQFSVGVEVGDIVKAEIRTDLFASLDKPDKVSEQTSGEYKLNCGKMVMFSSEPSHMMEQLKMGPFRFDIFQSGQLLAYAEEPWKEEFFNLVKMEKLSDQIKHVSASMDGNYELMEDLTVNVIGHVQARVRLSFYGSTIESNFKVMDADDITTKGKQYLFKNESGADFQCEKGEAVPPPKPSEAPNLFPLCPILNSTLSIETMKGPYSNYKISFTALSTGPTLSTTPEEFQTMSPGAATPASGLSYGTFDILSIIERQPKDKKALDLHVKASSVGFSFTLNDAEMEQRNILMDGICQEEELTVENIERKLCTNKDCPAHQKFKQFGIGPLASSKGVGRALSVVPPCAYGLSNECERLENFGPEGLFSRPKRPDDPFVHKRETLDAFHARCWKPKRGGEHRLRGGGIDYEKTYNPLAECQDIMSQFDDVLQKYKQALGPCGKPTCPFVPNITNETCKTACKKKKEVVMDNLPQVEEPPAWEHTPKSIRGACGSTKCPFTKYSAGLAVEDDAEELQYLPTPTAGLCGSPTCPASYARPLPPIHWDCPDPLPKGRCTNPNCPYLPDDLKQIRKEMIKTFVERERPPPCPPPEPKPPLYEINCSNPACPAMTQQQNCPSSACPFNKKPSRELCQNPNCPLAQKQQQQEICDNPECPYAEPAAHQNCPDPACPYNVPKKPSLCQNPQCPLAQQQQQQQQQEICNNPECPYAERAAHQNCPDPACPYNVPKKHSLCQNPQCPLAQQQQQQQQQEICNNPECPYAEPVAHQNCPDPACPYNKPSHELCQNPQCPLAQQQQQQQDTCDNPECPYAKPPQQICPNPSCPFAKIKKKPSPCFIAEPCRYNAELQMPQPCATMPPCPLENPCCPFGPPSPAMGFKLLFQPPNGNQQGPGQILMCYASPSNPCQAVYQQQQQQPPVVCGSGYQQTKRRTSDGSGNGGDGNGERSRKLSKHHYREGEDKDNKDTDGIEYSSDTRINPLDSSPCTRRTCMGKGQGRLECDECARASGNQDKQDTMLCYPTPMPCGHPQGMLCPFPVGGAYEICLAPGPCPFMNKYKQSEAGSQPHLARETNQMLSKTSTTTRRRRNGAQNQKGTGHQSKLSFEESSGDPRSSKSMNSLSRRDTNSIMSFHSKLYRANIDEDEGPPEQVTSEARHPVIVYIHGESFEWNSGNPYDGSVLASYADLVVVTLNYRLGILGFLNANPAPHLKARVANYGLMDQIAALHWIQQNIALFGGDPDNVTLAGHGSGAACINFLMISPTVMPGLFHRAILLSGSALSSWALVEDPVNYAVKLAREVNCTIPEDVGKDHEAIVDCLRETPLAELLHADVEAPAYLSAFGPSVDGVVIKTDFAKELVTYFKPSDLQSFVGPVNNANMKRSEATLTPRGTNPYDLLFGVVTSEALWRFSAADIQAGFEGERRDKIVRTYVRNAYTYHLSEIFFTVVNEYTDWERTVQHPINTRDAAVAALSDAQFVAPLVQTGDLLSAKSPQAGQEPSGARTFFYVFDYQTKDGDYPQRMGTVHGEELPYIFGAPLVDGFNHFPRNYTRSELALAEAVIIYIANFARTGNPNEQHKQEPVLAASRERNRFRSIVWDEYDSVHQKYLEIGMKPRMKNHFRAHQLSVWLRLIPELHRAGMEDVVARHNLFRNHNNADLYDGAVRPDPLSRVSYYDPTMELFRRRPNSSLAGLDAPTTMDTAVTTCVNVAAANNNGVGNYNHQTYPSGGNHNSTDTLASLEAAGYAAYSTALSVTIAIGCSLLILNVLIFAGVYYQRDKTRMEVKSLQQQQNRNQQNFETISKHGHYHMGHSQSANVIVDVEQDTSAMIMAANAQEASKQHHLCPTIQNALKAPPPSPMQNCMTLPKNASMHQHHQQQQQHHHMQNYNQGCMTLPKNATLMNNTACVIAEMQQQGLVQPPNGNATMPLNVPRPPPPPRAKSPPESQPLLPAHGNPKNMRVPQAAMSEMRV